ncbi:MAG: hypothetical protein QXX03_08370 [Nitrososphaerota archaeon]
MGRVITTSIDDETYNKIKNNCYKVSLLLKRAVYCLENHDNEIRDLKNKIEELSYFYEKLLKSRAEICFLSLKLIDMLEKNNVINDKTQINKMEVKKWKMLINQFLNSSRTVEVKNE